MNKYSIDEKVEIISQLASEKKAENLILLDVDGISSLTDKILIYSGNGTIHTIAIAKYLVEEAKKMEIKMHHQEGLQNGIWVLLDFGDVIVHIFDRDARNYYKLEELWQEIIAKTKLNYTS